MSVENGSISSSVGARMIAEQQRTAQMRNQFSQDAAARRGQALAAVPDIMASSFNILAHTMTSRGGLVDVRA